MKKDVFNRIIEIIYSCKQPLHFNSVDRLISNYENYFKDKENTQELKIFRDKYYKTVEKFSMILKG